MIWTRIQPGDTLYIVGTHVASGLVIQASGMPSAPITIRGDRLGFAPGVIDGGGTVGACVYDNDGSHDIAIVRLSIRGCTSRGIQFRNGHTSSNRSGLTLRDVHVADIVGPSAGYPTCVWVYGEGVTIRRSLIENCGDDGIWIVGLNSIVERNWFEHIGTGAGVQGDCVQLSGTSGNFSISGNYCNHLSIDEKQCYIANGADSSVSGGRITDNICILPRDGGTKTKGIYNSYDGALIARNFVTGGESGIWNVADATIIANIVTGFSRVGIYNGGGASAVALNNTVVGGYRTGYCLLSDSFSIFANNVVSRCEWAFAAYRGEYHGINRWVSTLAWDNVHNTGSFATAGNNPVSLLITSESPNFSGNKVDDPLAWRTSIESLATDVSSYPPALLDYLKEIRASGEWGAL